MLLQRSPQRRLFSTNGLSETKTVNKAERKGGGGGGNSKDIFVKNWSLTHIHIALKSKNNFLLSIVKLAGDVAQLVQHRTGTPTQVRFPGAARDFPLRVIFQCRLSYGVRTPPYAIARVYI